MSKFNAGDIVVATDNGVREVFTSAVVVEKRIGTFFVAVLPTGERSLESGGGWHLMDDCLLPHETAEVLR